VNSKPKRKLHLARNKIAKWTKNTNLTANASSIRNVIARSKANQNKKSKPSPDANRNEMLVRMCSEGRRRICMRPRMQTRR
jgi:hypothetical protein